MYLTVLHEAIDSIELLLSQPSHRGSTCFKTIHARGSKRNSDGTDLVNSVELGSRNFMQKRDKGKQGCANYQCNNAFANGFRNVRAIHLIDP
eukprot:5392845-Amphidinium_carterae.1